MALIINLSACTGISSSDGKSSGSSQQSFQTQAPSETKSEMKEISFPAYTIENGEVGVVNIEYMDPNDIANHPGALPDVDRFTTTGIVAYDIERRVSVAIAFMPDTVTKEQATKIAKKVEINPAVNN